MIRFGIVGAAGIARKFARDLAYVEHAKLTAVSASTLDKALKYQVEYQTEHAFRNYEDMAKSDVIDAVYIATPHNFHFEHALLFIKHHKHVLIEKPITVNHKQLEVLSKEAAIHHVLMMEAMWTHFLPATRYLVQEMKKGTFGPLLHADIKFGFPIALTAKKDGRLLNPNLAGGSLLDLGIYPVSFVSVLQQSKIEDIKATARFTRTGVDKGGTIKLKDQRGTTYTLKHNMMRPLGDRATFTFEKATVIMPGFHGCQSLIINHEMIKLPYPGEGFAPEIEAFVKDIEQGALYDEIMSLNKSLETMKLMDAIRHIIGLKYPFEV